MKESVRRNLDNALAFIGQAQERAPNSSALWKELGRIYDEVDEVKESVADYDEKGELE